MSDCSEPETSWGGRELVFELQAGKGELYSQKNKSEETRKKILHIKGLIDREVIGEVDRVHYGTVDGKPACLFVARFKFRWHHSALRVRKIEVSFTAAKRNGSSAVTNPIVKAYSPKHIFGLWSTQHKEYRFDISAQCSMSAGPAQVQLGQVAAGRTTSHDMDHALEITGMDWQEPEDDEPSSVIFTVDENDLQNAGVPQEMFFGVVFEHEGEFQVDVRMDVSDFTAWPWSKDDPILLGTGKTFGKPPRTLEFDKLTDNDWQQIVPYRAERENIIAGRTSSK